jgi:hypothetical protein
MLHKVQSISALVIIIKPVGVPPHSKSTVMKSSNFLILICIFRIMIQKCAFFNYSSANGTFFWLLECNTCCLYKFLSRNTIIMTIFHSLKFTVDGFEKRVVLHDFFTTDSFTHPNICNTYKKGKYMSTLKQSVNIVCYSPNSAFIDRFQHWFPVSN